MLCEEGYSPQVLINGLACALHVRGLAGHLDQANGWGYLLRAIVNARKELGRFRGAAAAVERGFTEQVLLLLGAQVSRG